ncbi:TPA: YjbF family lipoprotein [Vibrio vulnificus]|uniref:YjbF family lipoprotein n=1 Tax=Vibrio vulnificus TaxID=672 RepID=UPI0019D4B81A|nr:YjbF family lipoprotein [Vibrio vulnificus]MBN8106898.1 YjbF family lipoprotein [Vibrio vulnificus]MCA0775916.1 YjbF family lipoprotein [Vibrio vulnificus]
MINLPFQQAILPRFLMRSAAVASLILLSGCVQRFDDMSTTLNEAFFGAEDITQTSQQVLALPYASTYMRINDGQRIFMVLGYAEQNPDNNQLQLKWVSSDGGMIVTENGRVVKTLNLPYGNLIRREVDFAHSQQAKPWQDNLQWQSQYDWKTQGSDSNKGMHYGYLGDVTLTQMGSEEVISAIWQQTLTIWQENIFFPQLDTTVQNQYWVNDSGQVMKSIQYLGPEMTRIEFEILKPFAEVAQ